MTSSDAAFRTEIDDPVGELDHVEVVLARPGDAQHFGFSPFPATVFAGTEDVRHEDHLDFQRAGAFARLAAASLDIETERARRVFALTSQWCIGENAANLVECLHI